MFFGHKDNLEKIEDFILKLTYPHEHNNHRPHAIRSQGVLFFLVVIILLQVVSNVATKSSSVLGFATNISETEVINLTNGQRGQNGLAGLKTNSSLNKAAALKAKDMFEDDYWAHFAPDGTSPWYFFGMVNYKYTWAGENLARDFATSSGVVSAWMASSGHRANILNSNFTEIGVAVVDGNLEGEDTTLVVQLFGRPVTVAAASETTSDSGTGEKVKASKVEANIKLPTEEPKVVAQTESENQEEIAAPKVDNSLNIASLPPFSLVKNATTSQKVTVSLLFMMFALLVFDSVVVFRKRHLRIGSHSLAHASMILLLIIISLLYGSGSVL